MRRDLGETDGDAEGVDMTHPSPVTDEWSQDRWVGLLGRIEHRNAEVGLRFWGPPLWLQVTMSGPDADRWPSFGEPVASWDWLSNSACDEFGELANEHADDHRLLAAAGRYTLENLILNAVHEIGEWFRFEGGRVFPAHRRADERPAGAEDQGNGAVIVHFDTGPEDERAVVARNRSEPAARALRLFDRLCATKRATGFTEMPGTTLTFSPTGPVITKRSDRAVVATWRAPWSASTLDATEQDSDQILAKVARDVHAALVSSEVDRICRAFHIDGRRPWRSATPAPGFGADQPDDACDARSLIVSIDYTGT